MSSADSKLSSTARSRMRPGFGLFEFAAVKDIYEPSRRSVLQVHGNGAKNSGPTRRGEVSPFVIARLLIVRPFMDGRPKVGMLPSVMPDVFGVRIMRWQARVQV